MSSPSPEPDPAPSRRHGAAARVEELYGAHLPLVRGICRGMLRDRDESEDAVQQTFLAAQRALANGSAPRDPAAWLATIARHECLARVRGRMREPLPVDAAETGAGPDAHTAAVRRLEAGELRAALAGLPAQQRSAILLRELRGFSYEEVAVALSVSTPAVESLLFRARRSLQLRLRESLASLSPIGLLQGLRELAARLGGAGVAAPAAAKVAALGLGAAVATGGLVTSQVVIGLGHAPAVAAPAAPRHVTRPARPAAGPTIWAATPPRQAPVVRARQAGGDSGQRAEVSDVRTVETGDSGGGDSATSGTPEDTRSSGGTPQRSGSSGERDSGSRDGSGDTTTSSRDGEGGD